MLFTTSLQYNIAITEESAEALALDESGQVNTDLLNEVGTIFVVDVNLWEIMHVSIYFFQVASVCYRQGNYHLATKKWTQAGNR